MFEANHINVEKSAAFGYCQQQNHVARTRNGQKQQKVKHNTRKGSRKMKKKEKQSIKAKEIKAGRKIRQKSDKN